MKPRKLINFSLTISLQKLRLPTLPGKYYNEGWEIIGKRMLKDMFVGLRDQMRFELDLDL